MRKGLSLVVLAVGLLCLLKEPASDAHNVGDALLWNREISRIFFQRCGSCHRDKGSAFSLMKHSEVQPYAGKIKELVLSKRMPPWGAVKGFGEFQNEQALSTEEIEMITDWVDSGTPRGNNPNALPPVPKYPKTKSFKLPKNALEVRGAFQLKTALKLGGIYPSKIPENASFRIVANLPDGHVEPLLWLYEYDEKFAHPFLFKQALTLPAGTLIRGVPDDASIYLFPGTGK